MNIFVKISISPLSQILIKISRHQSVRCPKIFSNVFYVMALEKTIMRVTLTMYVDFQVILYKDQKTMLDTNEA